MNGSSEPKGRRMSLRGVKRCTTCFDMRFEATAKYAKEHGFDD